MFGKSKIVSFSSFLTCDIRRVFPYAHTYVLGFTFPLRLPKEDVSNAMATELALKPSPIFTSRVRVQTSQQSLSLMKPKTKSLHSLRSGYMYKNEHNPLR
ncbi:hypothetical protein PoB_001491300 [Plakobranchus ocellatus]|uniref:Uncharacterized protein n=1 Tax=Plakobranchus ocellatus TaxID=259542 RepID=A0AAV3Z1B7_9GAST|nr:hypothetical protein PoB_001491300 [Plakobranchus ocellatus]